MNFSKLLGINKGVICVIGGGGKTTLIDILAHEISDCSKVIVATTTHMYPLNDIRLISSPCSYKDLEAAFEYTNVIQTGLLDDNGKLTPSDVALSDTLLVADYVLLEADGSKGKPLKAHLQHEPVIPKETSLVIEVVGSDGFNKKISSVCHRYERFCELCKSKPDDVVTPERLASVLQAESLSDVIFVNKVEDDQSMLFAEELKMIISRKICAGSLHKGEGICLL